MFIGVGLWILGMALVAWSSWSWIHSSSMPLVRGDENENALLAQDVPHPLIASEVDHVALEAVKLISPTENDKTIYWTFKVPKLLSELLMPEQYAQMCASAHMAAMEARAIAEGKPVGQARMSHKPYYWVDDLFKDPADDDGEEGEAIAHGVGSVKGERELPVCNSTLTYLLDETDARIGTSLMGIWTAYALAQREGRAFFIDDSRWVYGSWSTYFQPPPKPNCRPPPKYQVIPCPRTARHLLITRATHDANFGHEFNEYFEDPRAMDTLRQRKIFALLREGYEALFYPSAHLSELTGKRLNEIRKMYSPQEGQGIAMIHIRHGDLHPLTFKYRHSYLPLDAYISSARTMVNGSNLLILSDATLSTAIPAVQSAHPPPAFHPELYTLVPDPDDDDEEDVPAHNPRPSDEVLLPGFYAEIVRDMDLTVRKEWAKSYVLDLSIARELLDPDFDYTFPYAGAESDGEGEEYVETPSPNEKNVVVCGLRAAGCRMLGVIVGWEGMIGGRWKNVDGLWGWRGLEW